MLAQTQRANALAFSHASQIEDDDAADANLDGLRAHQRHGIVGELPAP